MGFIKVSVDSVPQCDDSDSRDGYKIHQPDVVRPSEPEDPNKKHFARIK